MTFGVVRNLGRYGRLPIPTSPQEADYSPSRPTVPRQAVQKRASSNKRIPLKGAGGNRNPHYKGMKANDPTTGLKIINPKNGKSNCVGCAIATAILE